MRLVQLLGEGVEELWEFPDDFTDNQIKESYTDYKNSEYDSFEEYIDNYNPQLGGIRKFVDEVYV